MKSRALMCSDLNVLFFASRRRHTRCALVTAVQTCALPIYLAQGVAVAMPNYDLAPLATVSEIVSQVCDSVLWLAGQGRRFGYDDNRIVISGHSDRQSVA